MNNSPSATIHNFLSRFATKSIKSRTAPKMRTSVGPGRVTRKSMRRAARFETLESRQNMATADFLSFGTATFSFAPDQTQIGQRQSDLVQTLDSKLNSTTWQVAFARAFQRWSQFADINFGFVDDNGAATGVYGPTQSDGRFGDVRISGFNLPTTVWAEAVSNEARNAGNWAGDVMFNTAIDWSDVNVLESVAMHEIGHVLGLEHSTNPNSPMYEHGPNPNLVPTAADRLALQQLHSVRGPDANEENNGNDILSRATRIKGSLDDVAANENFNGSQVWIHFGSLLNSTDVDVFRVNIAPNYSGPIAFEVRTKGYSLARLQAELLNENGTVLATTSISGTLGGVGKLEWNATVPNAKYFVRIKSGPVAFWSMGNYAVTVATPTRLTTDGQRIADWARNAHQWYFDSRGAERGFTWLPTMQTTDQPILDDDLNQNNTIATALFLEPAVVTSNRTVHRYVGTISSTTDRDFYRVQAPSNLSGPIELTIDVESLKQNGYIPEALVYNANRQSIPAEVRSRGFGNLQLVVPNAQAGRDYYVHVMPTGTTQTALRTGNYVITMTWAAPTAAPEVYAQGRLTAANPVAESKLYIAQPQLFSFSLGNVSLDPAIRNGQVWVTIYNLSLQVVTRIASPIGQVRSAPAVLLNPGTYFIQVSASLNVAGDLPDIDIRVFGNRPSRPIGPVVSNPGTRPRFQCPGTTDRYCYPLRPSTPTTFGTGGRPTTVLPAPTPPRPTADKWFWTPPS